MSIVCGYLVPHPPLILPEIGRGEEKKIQKTIAAYKQAAAEIASSDVHTIVIISPHCTMYADFFHISTGERAHGTMAQFRAHQCTLSVDYDVDFIQELCRRTGEYSFPASAAGEQDAGLDHATFIPLAFISNAYHEAGKKADFKIVRIGVSGLSLRLHARLGRFIAETSAALGHKTACIASGDLSHKLKHDGPYGFAQEGPAFDARICDIVKRGALHETLDLDAVLCDRAAECGLRPLATLAGALEYQNISGSLYSYEGPFGVGYAVGSFFPQ